MTAQGSGFGTGSDACVYNMDVQFILELFGADENLDDSDAEINKYIEAHYPGGLAKYKADSGPNGSGVGKIPFRYKTTTLYGFCVPVLDSEELGAFGE